MKTVNLFESLTREKLQTIKGGTIATSKHTSIVDIDDEDEEDADDDEITAPIGSITIRKTKP
ncbi:hypothetical protein CXF68_07410 [Tenacibaculum sp. Bg11-29]|uniref:hypothetical protein n=1 Tax=Tenacibaculum sp. Bg11-29 TaxID=2058306 RepID=UPI000C347219|nr:hypothetical protein [Tenacibaculum sp. Bg11-29]PKH50533.1 hypothetical protein CXF68_07410 [Tenacibaculum sp. Bg11-29]